MSKIIYDPLGQFEQNENKGGVCQIKQATVKVAASTTGATLVAAVTGKIIRVISIQAINETAHTLFNLTSSGLGDVFYGMSEHQENYFWLSKFGVCDSNTSQALLVDNGTGGVTRLSVRYIEVVP